MRPTIRQGVVEKFMFWFFALVWQGDMNVQRRPFYARFLD
jgi:hypothetical protein